MTSHNPPTNAPVRAAHDALSKRALVQKYLHSRQGRPTAPSQAIMRTRNTGFAPLSWAQQAIWTRVQRNPSLTVYNESVTVHRRGPLNIAALERSFSEIIRRHEIWRTTFDVIDGRPAQIVNSAPVDLRLPVIDLRHLPIEQRLGEAIRLGEEESLKPFDLKRGPLNRPMLVRLDDEEYSLFIIQHQMILDGVSAYQVFLTELVALYESFAAGEPSPLPEPKVQFSDYARWQREQSHRDSLEPQLAYWRKQLAGELPVLKWPTERDRPPMQSWGGTIAHFKLPKSLTNRAKTLRDGEGTTLFVTLLTAFAALLHSYTGQLDFIVGTVSPAGRKREELQPLLGYFLNPVPLRLDLSGDPTVREMLARSHEVVSGALSNDDVPFDWLAERFAKPDPSRNPLFTVATSLEPPVASLPAGWDLTPMDLQTGGSRWDLYFVFDDRPDGFLIRVQHNPDLFSEESVERMVKDYQSILEPMTGDQHLSELLSKGI